MGILLTLVSFLLLLFLLVLVARAVLDWAVALSGPGVPGTWRPRLTTVLHAVTEPVLAPVRRVLPPLQLGAVGIDLAFIVVFGAIVVLRAVIGFIA